MAHKSKTAYADAPATLSGPKPKKYGEFDAWEVESAERKLLDAAEVIANKALLKHAMQCFRRKSQQVTRMVDVLSAMNRA